MTAIPVPASAPGSASSPKPAHLDAKVANDLDALWRSVFERAHADETHDGRAAKAAAPNEPTHDDRGGREARRAPHVQSLRFNSAPDTPQSMEHRISNPTVAPPTVRSSALASISTESSVRASVAAEPEIPAPAFAWPLTREAIDTAPSTAERVPSRYEAVPIAAVHAWADESVSVFLNGGAVMVNVRDRGLTEDEALRCAFETARTLTGERASLQTLMLNGRAVYRQAPQAEAPAAPTLVFAC